MTLRAYQPAFAGGELSPALWARVDTKNYALGLKTALNLTIQAHGGATNRAGLEFVGEVKASANHTRLIPFQFNESQAYVIEFGQGSLRFWRNGGLILASGGGVYEVATPYSSADLSELVFAQEADVMYLVHPKYPVKKLSRFADNNWTLTEPSFTPAMPAPTGVTALVQAGTSGKTGYIAHTYRYKVAAVSAATGEESLPSLEASCVNDLSIDGGINRVAWPAVTGASKYVVYKFSNGSFGYIGSTTELLLDDENITADTADGPQIGRNPFSGPGNYPRAVTFIQQRLALASTDNEPQAVYLSQTANYENFGYASPAKDSDAITFRMRARQVNIVRSMLAARYGLLLMTSSAEWVVTGGQTSDAITPSAIVIANQGYRGAASVQPINVGETVLFAQRSGGVIRDFSYSYGDDAWVGKDLTIMSRHLFENRTIKSWAYAQAPSSIVWVVLDDGSLVSLTYMKEHEVWAWTRHESGAGAFFEDVTCIAEKGEDVPYFVVRRTINGETKRYIERLHTRAFDHVEDAFFVDCGLTYTGALVSHLSGLSHLEGCELVALCDGNVVRGLTVQGGAVTLPMAAAKIHIGLPYAAVLQTLDLDLGSVAELGTVQGRFKSISKVVLRVEKTRGIFIGPRDEGRDSDKIVEFKQRSTEAWNEAIGLYTGDIDMTPAPDWNRAGGMFIKQFDPLPMSILAIMPEVTLGR
ncbi:hypothetical protein [Pleomorphomonas oryzae]|uniref:phage nozzle protein n=1 Tax=Pleomorphomonas oryzae TaxID=261934 RepID=UPI0004089ADE|nr:hypothetical protein [Pleomorphomonas oryzae]